MKKMNCIIVDDEPLALDILEEYIRRTPALRLAGRFTSSADALNLLRARGWDGGGGIHLAFLDIHMPGMDGLDLAKAIGKRDRGGETRIVFTTAFPQYALEGFRVEALDYLLKPISFEEFSQSVARAVSWFGRRVDNGPASRTANPPDKPQEPQTLIVKSGYKQFVIPLGNIVYIEGIRDHIRIHTRDAAGRTTAVQTLMNLRTVEEMLPADRFARLHRSYIVALDRVKRLERGHAILDYAAEEGSDEAVSLPVSDTYKESFVRALAARAV